MYRYRVQLLLLALHPTYAYHIFAAGSSYLQLGARSCGSGTIGLIDSTSGEWVKGSCLPASWADDVLTSTTLPSGEVIAYVVPAAADTMLVRVNFKSKNVSKAIVGGNQGELRCLDAKCYGVSPESGSTPTQLIEVDTTNGDSRAVLALEHYGGYLVDGSVIDPVARRYHAVLVGKPHEPPGGRGELSNQWLVTIDLSRIAITAEVPVSRYFSGPFSLSAAHGLATLGADHPGLVAVDFKSGKARPIVGGSFGTIEMYNGAFSRTQVFIVNVYPHPTRLFTISLPEGGTPTVTTNTTFNASIHALSAAW